MEDRKALTVQKFIRAPRSKVFAAWTQVEVMRHWFCPEDLTLTAAECDARVGGRFHAQMRGGSETHTVNGVYREVIPDQKLVFTHRWEERDAVETLVSVDFTDQEGGTLVTVTHAGLRNEESAKGHETGWHSTLDHLQNYLDHANGGTP